MRNPAIGCLLLCGVMLLAACGSRLVKPGVARGAKSFEVTTPVAWTRLAALGGELWTIDGELLNQLSFIDGVRAGQHVLSKRRRTRSAPDGAYFKPGLDALQLQQLFVDAYAGEGMVNAAASGLRPARFGEVEGFRFELAFASPEGLIYRGKVLMAERDARLYALVFLAPGEYYFERDAATIDRVFDSARLTR